MDIFFNKQIKLTDYLVVDEILESFKSSKSSRNDKMLNQLRSMSVLNFLM